MSPRGPLLPGIAPRPTQPRGIVPARCSHLRRDRVAKRGLGRRVVCLRARAAGPKDRSARVTAASVGRAAQTNSRTARFAGRPHRDGRSHLRLHISIMGRLSGAS